MGDTMNATTSKKPTGRPRFPDGRRLRQRTIFLRAATEAKLTRLAAKRKITESELIRNLVEKSLEKA